MDSPGQAVAGPPVEIGPALGALGAALESQPLVLRASLPTRVLVVYVELAVLVDAWKTRLRSVAAIVCFVQRFAHRQQLCGRHRAAQLSGRRPLRARRLRIVGGGGVHVFIAIC